MADMSETIRVLSEYWKIYVSKKQFGTEDIQVLLDAYRRIFDVDTVYIMITDPDERGALCVAVSCKVPEYRTAGQHIDLTKEQYDAYLGLYGDDDVAEKSLVTECNAELKAVLHYAVRRGDTLDGVVGMRDYTQERTWTDDERRAIFMLGRAVGSFVTMNRLELIENVMETEQKRLAEALEAAEAANKAKSAFLFNMSHDIRTPMNAILGFSSLLEMEDCSDEERGEYVDNIRVSGEYLLSLLDNVLEMSRIESGKALLDEDLTDIYQLVDQLHAVFEKEYDSHELNITREININHSQIYCDVVKCREIFLNIMSNSVKFTPKGGKIKIKVDETETAREGYGEYHVELSDTGIGMAKEFLPHIFDNFSREKTVTENKIVGTGLGMSIVRKYVEMMGGSIEVKSELGLGTAVSLVLPFRLAEEEASEISEKPFCADTEIFKGRRFLLAEDNRINAEVVIQILSDVGATVDHVEDGVECVARMQAVMPDFYDLILMDIQMPRMDGYKAAQSIRHMLNPRKARIPIYAITANVTDKDRQDAKAAGMNGHISKPIDIRKLMAALKDALNIG